MRTVSIYKAQKLSHEIDGVTIVIEDELPTLQNGDGEHLWLESEERFVAEAESLFIALRDTLPGGTMDRLIGKLLSYKASQFVVNYETKP